MARQQRATSAEAQEAQFDLSAMMSSNGENLESAIQAQAAMVDGMTEIGREMISFMSRRQHEAFEASRTLMSCKSPEEAFRLQSQFAESASREYFDEARKVMDMAVEVARRSWAPMEERTNKALKNLQSD